MEVAAKRLELMVRIPRALSSRRSELVPAFGYGCHMLLVGERPQEVPAGESVATRISMSERDWHNWERAQQIMPELSKAKLATMILALVDDLKACRTKL